MPVEALPISGPILLAAALPGDLTACTITFGTYADVAGTPLATLAGRLYPVDPATGRRVRLINTTTGHVLLPSDIPITITAGVGSIGPIPHTDNASLAPAGFAYRVEWDLPSSKPSPGNRTFLLPSSVGDTVDFDLLVDADTTIGVVIAVPAGGGGAVASVNGQIGAVVLDAGDVGAQPAGSYVATSDPRLSDARTPTAHAHPATDLSDSTTTGRAVITAANAAAARTAIGAGTSSLVLGTTAGTAKAGDYAPTKTDVGLGNVDNTADTAKPVSTAQQTAIDAAKDRANHTGTQSADTLTDGTTNKAYTATERTKLTGIASGATANATDANLRDRANHTGTQAATTITGLAAVATSGSYSDLAGAPDTGPPMTFDPRWGNTSVAAPTANRAYYARTRDGGVITGVQLDIGVSSGNICVAVYRNTGSGPAARPGTRVATSGTTASPGTGAQTISFGGSVTVQPGDWFYIAADNATITFRRALNAGLAPLSLFCQQDSAFPAPATAGPVAAAANTVLMVGT